MVAVAAAQSLRAVGQDPAFEEGVAFVFAELWQVGAGSVPGLGEEGRSVLLNQAVQRGPLGDGGGESRLSRRMRRARRTASDCKPMCALQVVAGMGLPVSTRCPMPNLIQRGN